MSTNTTTTLSRPWLLGVLLALGPVVWLTHLLVAYALVPTACRTGGRWPLHLVTVVALVAGAASIFVARRVRRRSDIEVSYDGDGDGDGAGGAGGGVLLATMAVLLAGYFLFVVVMAGVVPVVVQPCA